MTELDRLRALNDRLHLVPSGNTDEERLRAAALFTRAAAWELRNDGWGNIRKTSGTQVDGLDTDKLLNWHTHQIVDIVARAGAADAAVAWQDAGRASDVALFAHPGDPFAGGTPVEPPPDLDDLVVELVELTQQRNATEREKLAQLTRIADTLEWARGLLRAGGRVAIGDDHA